MQADSGVARRLDTAFKAPQTFSGTLTQPSLERANRRGAIMPVLSSASTSGRKWRERWDIALARHRERGAPLFAANATGTKETVAVRPYPPHGRVRLSNLG